MGDAPSRSVSGSRYAKSFFDLQLHFADKVAELSGLPITRTVFEYTNLYIRFGLGRDFDPDHPIWREYVAGLENTSDRAGWTYRFYLTRSEELAAPPVVATFGCFSYGRLAGDRIRLHFRNGETNGRAPLSVERRGQRVAELTTLFGHVKRTQPQPLTLVGASWLYNIEAYRRLFPPSYLATARAIGGRFRHMSLWGQFVDRHGEIKQTMTRRFLERLDHQSSVKGLDDCFPFQVLRLEAPVLDFYDFYAV
jgi:hypothetical protein